MSIFKLFLGKIWKQIPSFKNSPNFRISEALGSQRSFLYSLCSMVEQLDIYFLHLNISKS